MNSKTTLATIFLFFSIAIFQSAYADVEIAYCHGVHNDSGQTAFPWIFQDLSGDFYLSFDQQGSIKIPMKRTSMCSMYPRAYTADLYNVILNGNSEGIVGSVDYGGWPNLANCYNSGEG